MVNMREAQSTMLHLYTDYIADGTVPVQEIARVLQRLESLGTREDLIAAACQFGLAECERRACGIIPHTADPWRPM